MSDTEEYDESGDHTGAKQLRKVSRGELDLETRLRMEMEKKDEEIEALKAKADERRRRQEEDLKKQEEEKARIEREKKQREEDERRRKEEVAQKKRQLELEKLEKEKKEQLQKQNEMSAGGGSKLSNVLKAKEDMQKSPEQLEAEKREILGERIVKLSLDGRNKDDLAAMAQKFFDILYNLHAQIYDLQEKYDRQKYDMMELAERARQIEKGKAKTRKSNIVHTGLGGSVFGKISENFPQAPGKISLFSRYERVTDRRTFKDRRELWAAPKKEKEVVVEKPKAKIKHIENPTNSDSYNRKPRTKRGEQPKAEEAQEEQQQEEQPQEEQQQEEEQQQNREE